MENSIDNKGIYEVKFEQLVENEKEEFNETGVDIQHSRTCSLLHYARWNNVRLVHRFRILKR